MAIILGGSVARSVLIAISVLMFIPAAGLFVWEGMWALVVVAGALPLLALVVRFCRRPKPRHPPEGYRGWPLWFVGVAFIHNRRFGMLFVAGLALQLAVDAIV